MFGFMEVDSVEDKGSVRKNGGKMIKEYLDQGYAVFTVITLSLIERVMS